MLQTLTVQIDTEGVVTLPKILRETYNLRPGDSFTLLDLGGVFVLSPLASQVDTPANQIKQTLSQKGETLDSMLAALREEREKYADQNLITPSLPVNSVLVNTQQYASKFFIQGLITLFIKMQFIQGIFRLELPAVCQN